MLKRIIALLLCALMLVPCLASCSKKDEDDVGAYITMYLNDDTFDFDPANAYYNKDTLNVVSLLFDTLFTLNEKGKVKGSLAKSYTIKEDVNRGEYTMEITLNETSWSNGTRISADDVVFAWKRLVKHTNDFAAASLLYDIKNARAVKEGDVSIDDLGVEALSVDLVRISFEGPIDYDQFLLNLTSVATAPLYENYVTKNADWAKKPSTMVTSGPYKIGKINYKMAEEETYFDDYALDDIYAMGVTVDGKKDKNRGKGDIGSGDFLIGDVNFFYLERNVYYYRDTERDAIDKSVTNYRILVDCSMSDSEILDAFKNDQLFYIGDIPLSLRNDSFVKDKAEVSNALSTFVLYMNEDALIDDGTKEGSKLFASAAVREALSLAIDRTEIANAIGFTQAATGLVPNGVFEAGKNSKKDFRTVGGELISTSASLSKAKDLLTAEGIDPSKFTFTVKVAAYDDVNVAIAELIVDAWNKLEFNVKLEKVQAIKNNDYLKETNSITPDVCDDLLVESIQRKNYEVIAFDYNAYSADAWSVLSSFATPFSGMQLDMSDPSNYHLNTHITGYNSQAYNDLMEAIYYIPYYANLSENDHEFLGLYDTTEEFADLYQRIKVIYDEYGIVPSTKSSDWTKQKALLLHKAEELLLKDMPVIPVVFHQNAVLVSSELKGITATYYIPSYFRKTSLKSYLDYVPVLENFPNVDWSKKGYVEEEEKK